MVCTFFGHKDSPTTIHSQLKNEIIKLIESDGVDTFYVGNHGSFDNTVISVLKEIKKEFDYINYYVVLAYMPTHPSECPTILPDGIETVSKKGAIEYRNRWMVEKSDYAITYIEHEIGGASKFATLASKKRKKVINLANL